MIAYKAEKGAPVPGVKVGDELVVGGMAPLGHYRAGHEKEGEPIPAALANGTKVTVEETGADWVRVKTADGKVVIFAHAKGAEKLSPVEKPVEKPAAQQELTAE